MVTVFCLTAGKFGSDYYFYHNDHLGTPQKMTASNGAVVWSAKYEAFGKAQVAPESTVVNNLRFPGQYYDGESGLHYNYYRYYNPTIGRYTRIDPLDVNSGDVNLYPYVSGNPVVFMDPYGLIRNPGKCLKSMMKAWVKCGDDLEKARKQVFKHLDSCEDEWGLCNGFGDSDDKCIDEETCEKWKDVGSASEARLKCANDSEMWKKAAMDNVSKKCAMAAAKSVVDCL